jgi:polysaccharide biosynthesis transport protein
MDFIYFFRVLFKRKWIILAAGLVAATIAYLLTRNEQKYYKSSTQISTGYSIKDEIVVGEEENNSFFETENKFNNVILISKSDPVINLLSYKLILHDLTAPKPFRTLTAQQKQTPYIKAWKVTRTSSYSLLVINWKEW